jgi:hypothetical protein
MGINIQKEIVEWETYYETIGLNMGPESGIPGGPKCTYNGVDVPCFVSASPKACITSDMLAAMLDLID